MTYVTGGLTRDPYLSSGCQSRAGVCEAVWHDLCSMSAVSRRFVVCRRYMVPLRAAARPGSVTRLVGLRVTSAAGLARGAAGTSIATAATATATAAAIAIITATATTMITATAVATATVATLPKIMSHVCVSSTLGPTVCFKHQGSLKHQHF